MFDLVFENASLFQAYKPFLSRTVPYYKPSLTWLTGMHCYITWEKAMCEYKMCTSMQYVPLIQSSDISTSNSRSSAPMSSTRNRWTINCFFKLWRSDSSFSRLFFRVYQPGELQFAKTFLSQFILKALEACIQRAGLLGAGDDGDRGLEGEDGLDFSDLAGKKPWGEVVCHFITKE